MDIVIAILRRRKWLALVSFLFPFCVAVSVAAFLPRVYRAPAVVIVQRDAVLASARAPATGELETTLAALTQKNLSRAHLHDLVTRFDLYPGYRRRADPEAVVERMRRDVQIDIKEVDQPGGRVAFAFTISYLGEDPHKAAAVANALAAFYVKEDVQQRRDLANERAGILRDRLEQTKKWLTDEDRRVKEFKSSHLGELPDQVGTNRAVLDELGVQLRSNRQDQVRIIEEKKYPADRPESPRRAESEGVAEGDATLKQMRSDLRNLRAQYTDRHPDVRQLTALIAAREQEARRDQDRKTGAGTAAIGLLSSAPSGESSRTRPPKVVDVDAKLRSLAAEEQQLSQSIAEHRRKIFNAPRREQELASLLPAYETVKGVYAALLQQYEDAEFVQKLAARDHSSPFRVIDPAVVSNRAAWPNDVRLALVGLVLALLFAGAIVLIAERLDTSFHTVDELRAFTRLAVLVSVPRIAGVRKVHRHVLKAAAVGLSLVATVVACYLVVHGNDSLVALLTQRHL